MAQVILNYILWKLGKNIEAQAQPEVDEEEDPYEGMDYHEDGGQIFPNAKQTQQELLQYRIWNQFVVLTKEDEEAEDAEIDRQMEEDFRRIRANRAANPTLQDDEAPNVVVEDDQRLLDQKDEAIIVKDELSQDVSNIDQT